MEPSKILYLSRGDVEEIGVTMGEIIETLDRMFVEKGEGRAEMPPKPGIHTRPNALIHAMPGYIPNLEAAGMKWIAGYPENRKRGLPYITGLLILNDPETGLPLSVMDATWITAMRTGAATAIAARYLARRESSTVGIVACGVQGRSNLEALSCLYNIRKVKAYDIVPEIAERYAEEMREKLQVEVEPVRQLPEAVRNLDMVVTSGPILKNPTRAIPAGWLAPGAFASAVDFDCYWQGAALREMDKIATDDLTQMRHYRQVGYFGETPEPYADLGEIAVGKKPGRQSDEARTVTLNLGLALEDVATAALVYRRALEKGIGSEWPL